MYIRILIFVVFENKAIQSVMMDRAVCNRCQFFFGALWWIYSEFSKASGCSEEVGLVTKDGCTCFRGNSHEGASDLDSQFDPFNAWCPVHLHD